MCKKLTTQEFIERAKSVHGEKYDYSKTKYISIKDKVCIICPIHGEFWQVADYHLSGNNCKLCSIKQSHDNQKLTNDEFIEKSNKVHNYKYDYSKVNYVNSKTKVCIICKKHGEFWQTPDCHIHNHGCPKCKNIPYNKSNTEDFIVKSKLIYGEKYDYSKVEYTKSCEKVCIICKKHGEFWQTPNSHLEGSGCPECGRKNISNKLKLTKEEFINKSNKVHDYKYDYSKVEYIDAHTKVEIICKEHGSFFQIPNSHLRGNGCPKCVCRKLSFEEFVEESNLRFNNKFKYIKSTYKNMTTKTKIICPIHGEFFKSPYSHLNTMFGCTKCSYEFTNRLKISNEEFIQRATEIHNNLYDYSKCNYINMHDKVEIICKKHGSFYQEANTHLNGCGCPKCKTSKGEIKIRNFLINNDILFEEQKRFVDCRYKYPLPFDFYIKSENLCIEYDGSQHFNPYDFTGKMTQKELIENFENSKVRDEIKNNYCKDNNINLLRIPYTEFNNIENILIEYLNLR